MSDNLSYKFSYRRRLPHIQPEGATFFVTSRLAGSLPDDIVEKLHRERDLIDAELAKIGTGHERAEKAYLASRRLFGKWIKANIPTKSTIAIEGAGVLGPNLPIAKPDLEKLLTIQPKGS